MVPLPHLVDAGSSLGRVIGGWHAILAWVVLGLIGIHVLAAIVHLFVDKDQVMQRMLPQ